jgi:protein arginine N-methyltransferase 5
MFSWFPIFFPFKEPLYLPSGSELEVAMWRLWDGGGGKGKGKIWYEWCAEVYLPLPIGLALGGREGMTPIIGAGKTGSVLGIGGGMGGQPLASPMMDAPGAPLSPGGASLWGIQTDGGGRVKIGGTTLHNPAGIHSWVGL